MRKFTSSVGDLHLPHKELIIAIVRGVTVTGRMPSADPATAERLAIRTSCHNPATEPIFQIGDVADSP